MTRESDRLALVTIAALDLRRRPDHRAELRSQLLLGEVVRMKATAKSGQWVRVENLVDGYRGWARAWGLHPVAHAEAIEWARAAQLRVNVRYAEIRTGPGRGALVSPAFMNARVRSLRARSGGAGGWRRVAMPDVKSGWIESRAVTARATGNMTLASQVRSLVGVPYLWGGRTPLGFDCSGFVQQLLAARGVRLPRDAREQYLSARLLRKTERPRTGDLVFFGPGPGRISHVGIMVGHQVFAHARGTVRLNSLDQRNRLCDCALAKQLRGFGRPDPRWCP